MKTLNARSLFAIGIPLLFLSSLASAFPINDGEFFVRAEASSPFIFGPDPEGPIEIVNFSGEILVREWPYPGYARTILPDGREQIEIEIVAGRMTGESSMGLVQKVHGDPDLVERGHGSPQAMNRGTLTQIKPGVDFPAHFEMYRNVHIVTPFGTLHHENPIHVEATVNAIPPIFDPAAPEFNVFRGTESFVPLLDSEGNTMGFLVMSGHQTRILEVIPEPSATSGDGP